MLCANCFVVALLAVVAQAVLTVCCYCSIVVIGALPVTAAQAVLIVCFVLLVVSFVSFCSSPDWQIPPI